MAHRGQALAECIKMMLSR